MVVNAKAADATGPEEVSAVGEPTLDPRRAWKILVVRPDRLGDVILSTPAFELLQQSYPAAQITALVQAEVVPLLKGLPTIHHFLVFDPQNLHLGFKGFWRLAAEIRECRFDVVVVLQSHWKIAYALRLAGIRYRVGPWSKFHSFLCYNLGLKQRRSQVEMHETDYNLQLLSLLGIPLKGRQVFPQVILSQAIQHSAQAWWASAGARTTLQAGAPLIVVHPGMGGSALNWPEAHYVELIVALLQKNYQVLVTAGRLELALSHRIEEALGSLLAKQVIFYRAATGQGIDFLAGLFALSDVVVAPSTGPLHLAVALKKRVVTFFSPIRVQSAVRWGPYLEQESQASVMVPEVYCGQDFTCLGHLCHYFPCMKSLSVADALSAVSRHVQEGAAVSSSLLPPTLPPSPLGAP